MARILILNWRCPKNPLSGGAEKVTLEHAKAWVKKGHTVTWLSGNYKNGKRSEVIEGVTIYRYATPFLIYFLAPFLYWFKWHGKFFDCVVDEIHGIPFLSPLWAYPPTRRVAFIHEVAQEIWDEMLPFPLNVVGKWYEKIYFFAYRSIHFLTISKSTKDDLVSFGIPKNNISIIPNGLSIPRAKAVPKKEKQLTFLFVSRLVKMKGIEEAIRIFHESYLLNRESIFWIVGEGSQKYKQDLRSMIEDLRITEQVKFWGYVDEKTKIDLYRRAHYLLHTSVREGFGLVVIEANSQGTPALVYDSPGLRDVVQPGVNGYVFKKGEYTKITQTVKQLWGTNKYRVLAQSAINSTKQYDWEKITSQSLLTLGV